MALTRVPDHLQSCKSHQHVQKRMLHVWEQVPGLDSLILGINN